MSVLISLNRLPHLNYSNHLKKTVLVRVNFSSLNCLSSLQTTNSTPNRTKNTSLLLSNLTPTPRFLGIKYQQFQLQAGLGPFRRDEMTQTRFFYSGTEQSQKLSGILSKETKDPKPSEEVPPVALSLSRRAQLKQAIKDYGSTVLVFHITMSLCSLGLSYLLVSSGLDVVALLSNIGVGEQILQSKVTQGASTFVIAYAFHKVFAPVRITITLTATPLIVKRLRTMGILKGPAKTK